MDEIRNLHLRAHEVEQIVPVGAGVSLGSIPWHNLETVRRLARHHEAAPEVARQGGDGLPIVALGLAAKDARRALSRIRKETPIGVVISKLEGKSSVTLLCDKASFALINAGEEWAIRLFRDRRLASDGGHALLITGPEGTRQSSEVYALIEMTLREAPPIRGAGARPARPARQRRVR